MKRSDEIGVLPVALYGKCYATGEPIETDWQDKKRDEEYIRKDKAATSNNDDDDDDDDVEEGRKRSILGVSRMKKEMKEKE